MKHPLADLILPLAALPLAVATLPPLRAQGSLTPPPGAPGPVMKTLAQIEPRTPVGPDTTPGDNDGSSSLYKITQPGSYFLTGHVTGVNGKIGIEIVASDVTLDLGGFSLNGGPGTSIGIFTSSGNNRITIRNGTVRDWGSSGIWGFADEMHLSALHLTGNAVTGVRTSGQATITDCTASGHTGDKGFEVGGGSTLTRVHARQNGVGIEAGQNSALVDCVATYNTSVGFDLSGATVTRCVANFNGGAGFDGSGVFSCCTANNNDGSGFSGQGTFENCVAWWNELHGFSVLYGGVIDCNASSNGEHGIRVGGAGSRIVGNQCTNNGRTNLSGAGIHLATGVEAGRHDVSGNVCTGNDRGIDVHSVLNRISDNHLTDNRVYGLSVFSQLNIITRNTARNPDSGAVNWNIAAGNRGGIYLGPAQNSSIITGASGGPGSGTTDPFANLSF
jgi:hypothetical protein